MTEDAIIKRVREKANTGQRWRARFARRDNRAGDGPEWGDFLGGAEGQPVSLNVTIRDKAVKYGRTVYPAGQILSVDPVTPKDSDGAYFGWAEYCGADYCGNGEFLAEEWRMQLLEEMP